METLESSRVCRLCGKHSGISIDIFDRNENHVRKINAVLPIMVHEMDLLPKHMCHRCSYKLEEFHKFYEDCLRTDANLKSQLSWMRKSETTESIGVPMVHIQDLKIKVEPPDLEVFEAQPLVDNVDYLNPIRLPVNGVQRNGVSYATYSRCKYCCDKVDQSRTPSAVTATTVRESQNPITELSGPIELQATRSLPNRERQSATSWENSLKDTGRRKPSTSSEHRIDIAMIKRDPVQDETPSKVVRNLRPRRGSVDYVGTKRKSSTSTGLIRRTKSAGVKTELLPVTKVELAEIKPEKIDDFERRILRPRKIIDYVESKRTNRSSKRQRSQTEVNARKSKLQCIGADLASKVSNLLSARGLRIKQEIVDQEENTINDQHRINTDLVSLPSVLLDVENDPRDFNRSPPGQPRGRYRALDKVKPLAHLAKKRAATYTPKFLRSQDVYLRNGKLKSPAEGPNRIRDHRGGINRKKSVEKKLMKVLRGTALGHGKSPGLKHIENNIKRFCEKCNVTFATKELYRLHACYI